MRARRRLGGGSLSLHLLALIIVPLVALALLGVQRIDTEQISANRARATVSAAELQRSIAAAVAPAQLEQITLEGLARIDALGVPRDAVIQITGVDLETLYTTNQIAFEAALDSLAENHGDLVLADGQTLSARLAFTRGELEVQRQNSNVFKAAQPDVRAVFDKLELVFTEASQAQSKDMSSSTDLASSGRLQLQALTAMTTEAGERGKALLASLVARSNQNIDYIVSATTRLEITAENYRASLDPDEVAEFDALQEQLIALPEFLTTSLDASFDAINDDLLLDPENIITSAEAILDHLNYLDALEQYSSGVHDDVIAELDAQANDAEAATRQIQLLVAGSAIASVLLLVVVGWSVLAPLRRLTRRAEQVGGGDLAVEPLHVQGPRDIRTLTTSMNEMMATLQSVDRQIAALTDDSIEPGPESPGAIGVSLRRSFEHLEGVTTQLHASEQLASAIVAQAADAIWTIDDQGIIRSANAASQTLVGVSPDEQIGTPIRKYLTTLDGEGAIVGAESSTRRCLVASSTIDDAADPVVAVIAHDITERLQFQEQLTFQAHHDALTGLPNRFAVLEEINNASASPFAVLFVDLDGFKTVNDVQGHVAGDAVLVEVANRLSNSIRPSDFVGRLGGDEFIVVMSDYEQAADVMGCAARLVREIELPYGADAAVFALSASVGVAIYADGIAGAGLSALEAVREADTAVYHAKRHGRGRVELFDRTLRDELMRIADLEIALRHAISNNELELYLQPIMDITTGVFTSAEALVRWNRHGHGMVSPADFIPIAERSALIMSIDRWMLTEACATLARWRDVDPDCATRIAVNISGRHLRDDHLLNDLDAAIAVTGADPSLLTLELTETQLLDDLDQATRVLEAVRAQGITVAIDDFGTGYSSLSYLQRLPIDTLKIDRSFVSTDTAEATSLLSALLAIGVAVDTSVVAEGIETAEQLQFLRENGCDRGQGFHLARPTPIADAELVLRTGAAHAEAPTDHSEAPQMLSPSGSAL